MKLIAIFSTLGLEFVFLYIEHVLKRVSAWGLFPQTQSLTIARARRLEEGQGVERYIAVSRVNTQAKWLRCYENYFSEEKRSFYGCYGKMFND